ncbi:type IV secretory system conjugative DNA transfer family protein [Tunicatimonas pelagia]|uniref:type IV secretory system conjugative DNA transfer family protein n=1 Tax=Tunicatimonas pelagia TaxID=931531 RepID=UPI0026666063|nr:type IV secretory system conjugative DNA transfer family protein [Tunicatimonas pelagia]WKN44294.1 type IV secretory system conjugative DNA transfer family protein [Tunicatimonas pelagia]
MVRPFVEALFVVFITLSLLLGVEYYVLAFPDQLPLAAEGLLDRFTNIVQRLGFAGRISWLLTYVGLCLSLAATNHNNASTKRNIPRIYFLPVIILLIVACYYLLGVTSYPATTMSWLYPGAVVSILILLPIGLKVLRRKRIKHLEQSEVSKINTPDSIVIRTRRGYINVPNPYRGTLIVGSSGSGKSVLGNAFLEQFVQKGFSGIVYDFKFPVLANILNTALHCYGIAHGLRYYIVNFRNLSQSHRCNPLAPENIPTLSHAEEYAQAIIQNLDTATIKRRDFFASSAQTWLTALIWFFRSEHPQYCTLPHVINAVLYPDYTHVISMLEANPQSSDLIRSIATAIRNKAEKQLAGVIASLQMMVTKLNSPEIAWVLSGDDFTLDINNPDQPKLLCLGSDPGLVDTFSPVISLIMTVALKRMNQVGKHRSFVLLDEAPTLYIPRFEMIPATARSNRIASVYMVQDLSQMIDRYGKDKAEVIIANLSNQFYGKASSVETARRVSEMIGREERSIQNHSRGMSHASRGGRNLSQNISVSQQERLLIKPQEVMQLSPGAFVGQTVESTIPYFRAQTRWKKEPTTCGITSFTSLNDQNVSANFSSIRREVTMIVKRYPNIYHPDTSAS